jgi:hypothetical protein
MSAEKIKAMVGHDVQTIQEHNDAVKKCVVDPSIETFEGMGIDEQRLWIVARKEEYCITYNEASGRYGLAFRNILGSMVYLGDDGSLSDAYETLISREQECDEPRKRTYKRVLKR